MTRVELTALIADLKRKLKARENMAGYAANVSAIKERLALAESDLAVLDG